MVLLVDSVHDDTRPTSYPSLILWHSRLSPFFWCSSSPDCSDSDPVTCESRRRRKKHLTLIVFLPSGYSSQSPCCLFSFLLFLLLLGSVPYFSSLCPFIANGMNWWHGSLDCMCPLQNVGVASSYWDVGLKRQLHHEDGTLFLWLFCPWEPTFMFCPFAIQGHNNKNFICGALILDFPK